MRAIAAIIIIAVAEPVLADDLRNEPIERDPGRFIERLLKAVPRGSSMQEAREFVEARGFDNCVAQLSAQFSPRSPPADFVLCTRDFEGTFYEVALFHEGRVFQRAGMRMRPISQKPQ